MHNGLYKMNTDLYQGIVSCFTCIPCYYFPSFHWFSLEAHNPPSATVLMFGKLFRAIGVCSIVLSAGARQFTPFQAGDGGWQLSAPAVGNIDATPDLEIVLSYRNSNGQWLLDAYKYDGTRLPGFPFNGGTSPINVSPTLADLDGDGRNEIVFTKGNE